MTDIEAPKGCTRLLDRDGDDWSLRGDRWFMDEWLPTVGPNMDLWNLLASYGPVRFYVPETVEVEHSLTIPDDAVSVTDVQGDRWVRLSVKHWKPAVGSRGYPATDEWLLDEIVMDFGPLRSYTTREVQESLSDPVGGEQQR